VPDGTGDYALELRTGLLVIDNLKATHNRLYIPTTATSLDFDLRVVEANVLAATRLDISIAREGEPPQVIRSIDLLGASSTFTRIPVAIPDHFRGAAATITFELAKTSPGTLLGTDRVWLDNIAFSPTGQPIQAESFMPSAETPQPLADVVLQQVMQVTQSWWQGLVQTPDGVAGASLGLIGTVAPDFTLDHVAAGGQVDGTQQHGNTGGSEGGFDNEFLFEENYSTLMSGFLQQQSSTEFGLNGNPALTTKSHAVQSQPDALLSEGERPAAFVSVVNKDTTLESDVSMHRPVIDYLTIGVTDLDVSFNPAAPSSEGAAAYLEILDLEKIPFESLQPRSGLLGQGNWLVGSSPFSNGATSLGKAENQQEQSTLQHSLSFGSHTLPPDRNVVNNSNALSAEQLALLSKATITIEDLADGYLALTTGTTITLDTDAAGYGWFIDQTPFLSEEFVLSAVSYQLLADPNGAAAGKIDLLTVLMHELGHVMNLGHVSSAVDGTRLMAGSIDPGIRRLPSVLDLGPIESSTVPGTGTSPAAGASPQTVWAPYLTHYTVTASGEQQPAPVINPATLVQAAHIPSHEGIFNSGFGITDPLNTQYGWDQSGGVTIANGQAVLSEDSNVISTLSQLFTLPAGATHLRFTLTDVNLAQTGTGTGAAGASPQDAFEVALLEASTMTTLAGVTAGLTLTDSLFNLQQDGTVRFSDQVTLSNGATSGSILDLTQPVIVDIDLTGIAVGAGARLSFDLLGFGDRTSTITIDNVLLTDGQPTAAPVAVNDSYTVAEGATLDIPTFGLLTNGTDSDSPQADLSVALVTGPLHGTLTLNADGSFSYIHNGSETVTDAFTYRVSDGINLSNVATVSFTITPTNDAPVLAAIPAQTVEQGRTLTVAVQAIDPDDSNLSPESSVLTYSLGTGAPAGASIDPTTGVFTWIVPRTQTVGFYQITVNVTDAGTPALSATRTFTVEVLELTNTPPTLDPIGPKTVNET
jgi:VCBS repeat-containing protein